MWKTRYVDKFSAKLVQYLVNAYFDGMHKNVNYSCTNFIEFMLTILYHIQINQKRRNFNFVTLKFVVLLISGQISGKFSDKLPT